jgi:hypothetical protein
MQNAARSHQPTNVSHADAQVTAFAASFAASVAEAGDRRGPRPEAERSRVSRL